MTLIQFGDLMSERADLTIIGGGIIGCAIAYKLSQHFDDIFVIEKNAKITAENQSSRNSGVVHAGVYYPRDLSLLKSKLCVPGNKMMYDFCEEFDVPCQKTGKIIVATNENDYMYVKDTLQIARENGVPDCRMISPDDVRSLEPNVDCIAAGYFPTSGIVEPTELLYKIFSLASNNGVFFINGTEVVDIRPHATYFKVTTISQGRKEVFEAEHLINAAGIYSDQVARMVEPDFPYCIRPVRGESAKFYKNKRDDIRHGGLNIYPAPYALLPNGEKERIPFDEFQKLFKQKKVLKTVGIHLTPTFAEKNGRYIAGNEVTLGPASKGVSDREDTANDLYPPEYFYENVLSFFPKLRIDDIMLHQVGIQAKLEDHYDWVIERSKKYPRCINLVGIDSPGLTACLAIGDEVVEMIRETDS